MSRARRAAIVLACVSASAPLLSCRAPVAAPQPESVDLVVVAPHPDDETLIAGGVLMAARARGARVAVIVVTNGDFTCERNGHVRETETVDAMATLGVAEADIHFLGYPDGWLAELGGEPLPPVERRAADGSCTKGTGTYGERGADGRDEHTARTGKPGAYVAAELEEDLASLLARLRPRDLYVTHPLDTHPDHAATYSYVRRALEHVTGPLPRLHRAIVHAGACWPNGRGLSEPCPPIVSHDLGAPLPALPDPYGAYIPSERMPVGDPGRKLAAIAKYSSQLGADPDHDWLTAFARSDEPFWPEDLTCSGAPARHCVASAEAAKRVLLSPAVEAVDVAPYRLSLEEGAEKLALAHGDRLLRRWTLPLAARDQPHTFDITAALQPGNHAIEVTVVRDGALLGVAIDPMDP